MFPFGRRNPGELKDLILLAYQRDPKTGEWKWSGRLMDSRAAPSLADDMARKLYPALSEITSKHLKPEEAAHLSGWEVVTDFQWKGDVPTEGDLEWKRMRLNLYVDLEQFQSRILPKLGHGPAGSFTITLRRRLEAAEVPVPPPKPDPMVEMYGEPISSYSRAQAIEDGVLVDLSALAPEVTRQHYKYPIAATAAVWSIIDKAVRNPRAHNDLNGVIHDILWMSKVYKKQVDPSTVITKVKIVGAGMKKLFFFKLVVGPGDHREPVITIMLPEED